MLSSRQSLRPGVKIVPVLVGKLNRQMAAALAADISWLIASSGISVGLVGCANMGHRGPLYGASTSVPVSVPGSVSGPAVCCRATCQPRRSLALHTIRSRKLCASACPSLVEC